MTNNELKSEKALRQSIDEGMKDLESISALDLMLKAGEFHKQLMSLVDSLHLPPSIIIGILMAEAHLLCYESHDFELSRAFELVRQYVNKHDSLIKKYVDENFMRKEK